MSVNERKIRELRGIGIYQIFDQAETSIVVKREDLRSSDLIDFALLDDLINLSVLSLRQT